jgi:hypothetical protein
VAEDDFYRRPVVVVGGSDGAATPATARANAFEHVPPPERFNAVKARETMRGRLALGILIVVGVEILLFFALAFLNVERMQDIKELGLLLFTPTIGVLGTVLGFYFGVDKATRSDRE